MKSLILLIMLSATSFLFGQQTEGLKTEKTTKASIMERKLPEKSNDSIAKNNLNDILKQKNTGSSILGTTNQYNSEVQMNVNKLNNNVNTFNNNTFNRMMPQGQGIQFNKRK
ncbi:hypothetical protein J2W57_001351 [Chryseobacterium ginsenosidimutans]|uniref:Uncharacterized protein n=2 Tax=Chryseobacterium geocarposphaerae TaxID=1416776 RepID=A0ABU1LDI0_9FLAO|nr:MULTISPECIES: hypothetical protein [Chryseobacterium]MDR6404785.1 hypothetical protein [Chryseobacterium geocarposphaerae]MDR6697983.1 hypothetical protein [Chryseobacterium ginsenosidimutans]